TIKQAIFAVFNSDSVLPSAFLKEFGFRHKDDFTFEDYQRFVKASLPHDSQPAHEDKAGWDLFLSYANCDSNIASELKDLLMKGGLRCFMASREIASGATWEASIREALLSSTEILLVLTPQSVMRQWVMI